MGIPIVAPRLCSGIFSRYRDPYDLAQETLEEISVAEPPAFPEGFKYLELDIRVPGGYSGGSIVTADGLVTRVLVANGNSGVRVPIIPHLERLMKFWRDRERIGRIMRKAGGVILPHGYC